VGRRSRFSIARAAVASSAVGRASRIDVTVGVGRLRSRVRRLGAGYAPRRAERFAPRFCAGRVAAPTPFADPAAGKNLPPHTPPGILLMKTPAASRYDSQRAHSFYGFLMRAACPTRPTPNRNIL
jgi:hypothetical protein